MKHPVQSLPLLVISILILSPLPCGAAPAGPAPDDGSIADGGTDAVGETRAGAFGVVPPPFVENRGQTDDRVLYTLNGADRAFCFTRGGVTVAFSDGSAATGERSRWVVRLDFEDAEPAVRVRGDRPQPATINRFLGPEEEWITGIPTFGAIVYEDLWPGIDMIWSGGTEELKYEFHVRPGADPRAIRMAWHGATGVTVTAEGSLRVETPAGHLEDAAPLAWQDRAETKRGGVREYVTASHTVEERDDGSRLCTFALGAHDPSRLLLIDPSMFLYCGYIGGTEGDDCTCIAVDSGGCVYVAGNTISTEATFPVGTGPDLTHNGSSDVFVAKIAPDGSSLVYCGYIGGAGDEWVEGITVDDGGNLHLAGQVLSDETTFPVVVGPDLTFNGTSDSDAFVARINAAGTSLDYCGYIGGADVDFASAIVVDGMGNAYVTGATYSDEVTFPVLAGFDVTHNGGLDAFVARIPYTGMAIDYCTYVGGDRNDLGEGIALDGSGRVVIAGMAQSDETTFPVTVGPDLTHNGDGDAFVARISPTGNGLEYCGYVGGAQYETASGLIVDGANRVYLTGGTKSDETTFPVAVGPDLHFNGDRDAFVAAVDPRGTAVLSCGYIGGSGYDTGRSIALDAAGHIYVGGLTRTCDATFPLKVGPGFVFGGNADGFVARVNGSDASLDYCGYIGGAGGETDVEEIAVNSSGYLHAVGSTNLTENDFPVIVGPDLTFNNGSGDGYVARIPPAHVLMRAGNTGTGAGEPVDVLLVNGSAGDTAHRQVTIPAGSQLTFTVSPPPGGPSSAPFVLYAWPGVAGSNDPRELALGIGTACFMTPYTKGNTLPPPYTLVNNIGYPALLGTPIVTGTPPAPATIGPFARPSETWTFQGLIYDTLSGSGRIVSLTNAVVVEFL